jgi:lipooligosaccharide transport system ATP-binding protein
VYAAGLTKRFGDLVAVDRLDLELAGGEAVAIIGPNGAGKTTSLRTIALLTRPTSGRLTVAGMDARTHGTAIRHLVGVVPQHNALDRELCVRDNLVLYGRFFGLSRRASEQRAEELLDLMDLRHRAPDRVTVLSGGQARRLALGRALMTRPELLILDEPTTGLDPFARQAIWRRVRGLVAEGATVLITSHDMAEVERLCDRVLFLSGGRVVDEGTPAGLVERHCARSVLTARLRLNGPRPAPAELAGLGEFAVLEGDRVIVHTANAEPASAAVRDRLDPAAIEVRRSTLEDAYRRLALSTSGGR